MASSDDRNDKKRKLSAEAAIGRKYSGKRPDSLCVFGGLEIGVVENAKSDDLSGDNYLYYGKVKLPKTLKSTLRKLVEENPAAANEIQAVGLVISGTKVQMKVVNNPKGCVCRVADVSSAQFPLGEKLFKAHLAVSPHNGIDH